MRIGVLCLMVYIAVGAFLTAIWFRRDYQKEYKYLSEKKEIEAGMVSLLLLFMILLWPIKLAYNFIKHRSV